MFQRYAFEDFKFYTPELNSLKDLIQESRDTPIGCTYSMNSTKRLDVNIECIATLFLQRRSGWLCIYSVKKHSGATAEDTYEGYMTETTRQAHEGVSIGLHCNRTATKYPLEI
jgi:hypothetical protein